MQFGFQKSYRTQQHGLSEKQIKDKEKELAPQEQDGLQNNMDVSSVLVTQPLESLTIGLVSFCDV